MSSDKNPLKNKVNIFEVNGNTILPTNIIQKRSKEKHDYKKKNSMPPNHYKPLN
jgi:hypothetical protein